MRAAVSRVTCPCPTPLVPLAPPLPPHTRTLPPSPDRFDLEYGDKILLPESAFSDIKALRLPFPLIFEVFNEKRRAGGVADRHGTSKVPVRQFSGVMEFSAPEGQAYIPNWMMSNLLIKEGGRVFVKTVSKVCTCVCGRVGLCVLCCGIPWVLWVPDASHPAALGDS